MSDRFNTTLHVSGPDAATAEKAAIEAIKSMPKDDGGYDEYGGGWGEPSAEFPQGFYGCHNSGEGAIQIVARISRDYPTETFCLYVNGDYGAGDQGHVSINNGHVTDARSEAISYGDDIESSEVREYEATA